VADPNEETTKGQELLHIAILTDLDMSGLLIAGKVPDIPRIGITLDTAEDGRSLVRYF
jgi:hypothetical protein